jgi:hypothetical protein
MISYKKVPRLLGNQPMVHDFHRKASGF